jgi:hypothetical protein
LARYAALRITRSAFEERQDPQAFPDPDSDRLILRKPATRRLWVISFGYRFQPSSRHFIGTVEQTQQELTHNQIQNNYHLLDISMERQISLQWSANVSMPLLIASHNQLYAPKGIYDVRGRATPRLVDVSGYSGRLPKMEGMFNRSAPETSHRDLQCDRRGRGFGGKPVAATADQSIQAGDGRLGFSMDVQAFEKAPLGFMMYFTGVCLFNPADTNSVNLLSPRVKK